MDDPAASPAPEPIPAASPAPQPTLAPSTAREAEAEKKPLPYGTIFVFVASCAGVVGGLHDLVTYFNGALEAVELALQHIDIFALVGGYIDGARNGSTWTGLPPSFAPYLNLLFAVLNGIIGMWHVMTSGGWLSMGLGFLMVACGIGAIVGSGLLFAYVADRGASPVLPMILFAVVWVSTGLAFVASFGTIINSLVLNALWFTPFAAWIRGNLDGLTAAFDVRPLPRSSYAVFLHTPPRTIGTYTDAGPVLWTFVVNHAWFTLETCAVGAFVGAVLFWWWNSLSDGSLLGAILLPSMLFAIIAVGASIAYLLDHLIIVPTIKILLGVAAISAVPIGVGALAFILEKGHIGMSLVESTRKLFGRA
jgi:hypothetical protein